MANFARRGEIIRRCFIGGNIAGRGGGAYLALEAPAFSVSVDRSHVWRNVARSEGGGLFLTGSARSSIGGASAAQGSAGGGQLTQCVVDGNAAWVAADNLRIFKSTRDKRSGCGEVEGGQCSAERAWRFDDKTAVSRLSCADHSFADSETCNPPRTQPPMPPPQIFVSVVSFRDAECARTLLDLFLSAQMPERLTVGLVEQHHDVDGDCLYLLALHRPEYLAQIRRVLSTPKEARGPVPARNLSRALHRSEHYFLSIDSHMRFACEWDAELVSLHLALNRSRAILTAYPPNYEPLDGLEHVKYLNPARLAALGFNEDGILRIGSVELSPRECTDPCAATPSLFWAAGYNFGRALSLSEVMYDARLTNLFWGEEMLMAVLLWTAGYDFYAPCDASLVLHRWSRQYRPTFWQQHDRSQPPLKSRELLFRLLLSAPQREEHKRSVYKYEEFANISIGHAAAGRRAYLGLPNDHVPTMS